MNTCSTCRWWGGLRAYGGQEPWGVCDLTDGGDSPAHPGTLAYAVDKESYSAILRTRGNFGCNQWEGYDPHE